MQIGSYIEQYEKAVLEWFNAAFPAIRMMTYAKDKEVLLAKEKTLEYPALLYYRDDGEHVLPKALEFYEPAGDKGNVVKTVMFQTVQPYTASLYLNNEADLYRVANILRQKWYQDSYVTMTYPTVEDKLRVGLFLKGISFETDRTGVDEKGPERCLRMQWQSTLLLEADYRQPVYTGFRLYITTPNDQRLRVMATCKGDKCTLGGR